MAPSAIRFQLYRDGNTIPVSVEHYVYYLPIAYKTNRCVTSYTANFSACTKADWAYVILPATAWDALGYTPAYMGYEGLTASSLYRAGAHAGYPRCDRDNSPAGCREGYKYGTTETLCRIQTFVQNHWVYRVGCDTSKGMSGGPFYDGALRSLLGHLTSEACTTCGGATGLSSSAPNFVLGHDDLLFSMQNTLRGLYP